MRMASLRLLIFLLVMFPARVVDLTRSSFASVKSGERLSLNCTFQYKHRKELIVWYKQQFGEMPQEVGKTVGEVDTTEFSSGFEIEKTANGLSLTILRTRKGDEGLYFCGVYSWGKFEFSSGTFVAVTDDSDVNVTVWQRGELDPVPAGASVTLQCSVLSESRAAELQVLWFRAATPQSHPQIIHTRHNSSRQCESVSSTHTCVYNFTKNILSLNHTGTYYCAVTACGRIVFGDGTRVRMKAMNDQCSEETVGSGSLQLCLVVALAVCVVVNCAQAILYCKKQNPEQCTVRPSQGTPMEKTHKQDRDAVELNYAALSFNGKKTQSGKAKQRQHQDVVYSQVVYTSAM